MDGDGRADIVLGFGIPPTLPFALAPVRILLQPSPGVFVDGTAMLIDGAVPVLTHPRQIAIADLNGDGRKDLFFAAHGYDTAPFPGEPNALLLSNGTRLRDASGALPGISDFSHSVAVADLDNDGRTDLFVGNVFGATLAEPYLLLNTTAGFVRNLSRLPQDMLDVRAGTYGSSVFMDIDNDGFADLVIGCEHARTRTRVLFGSASGQFSERPAFQVPLPSYGGSANCVSLLPIDLNRDGRMDLIVNATQANPFYEGAALQVLINTPSGFVDDTAARVPQASRTTGPWVQFLRVADLNGDGAPDLFAQGLLGPQPQVVNFIWLNDGKGVFTPVKTDVLPEWAFPYFAVAIDVNGDGRADVVRVSGGGSTPVFVDVFLSTP